MFNQGLCVSQSFSQKVARLFAIRDRFEAGARCTVLELAEEFDVSRRTIFRDIELLKELNFPLAVDKTTGAYFLVEEASNKRPPLADERAIAILLLAARVSPLNQILGGTHLIRTASAKLLSQLAAADRTKVGKLLSMCVQEGAEDTPTRQVGGDVLLDIVSALQGRSSVELTFRDGQGQLATAHVFLRQLKLDQEGWYVEGRDVTGRESIRVRLDRIQEVSATTRTAEVRGDEADPWHVNRF